MTSKNPEKPWHAHLSIDLLALILQRSIFHPFIAWLIPLCLRARAVSYANPSMHFAIIYAVGISLLSVLSLINRRVAYGSPRAVDLTKEVIVITGGAKGLGLLIAEVYGLRGASVAVLDVAEMDGETRGVEFYRCDVGERAEVERVAKQINEDVSACAPRSHCFLIQILIVAQLGTPTILINNAVIVNGRPLLELSAEQIERNFRVNLLSHFYTLQTFLPGMLREKRGTIVTISSVLAHLGCRNLSDYTAAKAGSVALHSSLIAELPEKSQADIKTLLVTPGQLSTSLFAGVHTPSTFLGPVVEPVEVAKAIIAAVDEGISGTLAMPLYARWVSVLGILPVGMQRVLRWASGMDRAMDGFRRNKED
ncbi:MAG: hypothetical protein M1817_001953 [Caeruleum heppii]|nr:MAG: hypothetical protein M1817_001953 [Caeruleum heppii]